MFLRKMFIVLTVLWMTGCICGADSKYVDTQVKDNGAFLVDHGTNKKILNVDAAREGSTKIEKHYLGNVEAGRRRAKGIVDNPPVFEICVQYPCPGNGACHPNAVLFLPSTCGEGKEQDTSTVFTPSRLTTHITEIPIGVRNLEIHLLATVDIDLKLFDANDQCLAGYRCANHLEGDFTYNGMSMSYSGDDTRDPVDEYIRIDHVKEPLTLKAYNNRAGADVTTTVTFKWDGISPCDLVDFGEISRSCEAPTHCADVADLGGNVVWDGACVGKAEGETCGAKCNDGYEVDTGLKTYTCQGGNFIGNLVCVRQNLCAHNCNGHGTCEPADGTCVCASGYNGDRCDSGPCVNFPCAGDSVCRLSEEEFYCGPAGGLVPTIFQESQPNIIEIKTNVRDLEIELVSNYDIDLQLLDMSGHCLAGVGCDNIYGVSTHNGMTVDFSGNDLSDPYDEFIKIPHVMEPLILKVIPRDDKPEDSTGTVRYRWNGINPCVNLEESARICECPEGQFYDKDQGCVEFDACKDFPCEDCGQAVCPHVGLRTSCEDIVGAANSAEGRTCTCINGYSGADCMVEPKCADVAVPPGTTNVLWDGDCLGKFYDQTCQAKCNDGYVFDSGDATFTCDDGVFGGSYVCKQQCADAVVPPGTSNVEWDTNCIGKTQGDSCTVKCANNYEADENQTNIFTCDGGVFAGSYTCLRQCSDVGVPPGTTHVSWNGACAGKTQGETCTAQCDVGYEVDTGLTTYTCGADGNFSGNLVCTQQCPDVVNPVSNAVWDDSCSGKTEGGSCTAKCADGYEVDTGLTSFTCQGGNFVGNLVCIQKCADVADLGANVVWDGACVGKTESETCTAKCNDGYEVDTGLTAYTCQNGNFIGNLVCVRQCADVADLGNNVVWDGDCSGKTQDETCTAKCKDGYRVDSGLTTYTCGTDGTFSGNLVCIDRCAHNCNGHGTCDPEDGTCVCVAGYDGDHCDSGPCADYACPGASVCRPNEPFTCGAGGGYMQTGLLKTFENTKFMDIRVNSRDLVIKLEANTDLDLRLEDMNGVCLAGYSGCKVARGEITYNGMKIEFSGDDWSDPVDEWIKIDHVTEPLQLIVGGGWKGGRGHFTYEFSGISPCPSPADMARRCECPEDKVFKREVGCVDEESEIKFDADYPSIVAGNEQQFLDACTENLRAQNLRCTDVREGSIIVTVEGPRGAARAAEATIREEGGLSLPGFPVIRQPPVVEEEEAVQEVVDKSKSPYPNEDSSTGIPDLWILGCILVGCLICVSFCGWLYRYQKRRQHQKHYDEKRMVQKEAVEVEAVEVVVVSSGKISPTVDLDDPEFKRCHE